MNLRDLKYLIALDDHRNFRKAARSCFVSQPALSIQIKKLEQYLGVQLLERTNKSVMFTEIGKSLMKRARSIISQADEMQEIAKQSKDPYSGELKLGVIPTLAPYLLPHIIPKLSKIFPKLSIYLSEEQTLFLIEKLKQGKIDAAILALPIMEGGLVSFPLFQEEFMLAVSPLHSLAKRKKIRPNDLEGKNLLLLEEGHCLREQALAFCQSIHASETQSFKATSLETLRHMVASGIGITLIPRLACKSNDGITYIPFALPKPTRTIGMLFRASTAKETLLKDVISHIKKIVEK